MSTPFRERLARANHEFNVQYRGGTVTRQPTHAFYGGAHLFKRDTPTKLGLLAQKSFAEYMSSPDVLVRELGIAKEIAGAVHERVAKKLAEEPLEDFHIDFEDGYGIRSNAVEDADASAAAQEAAEAMKNGVLPEFFGIRIKPLSEELYDRSLRTLQRFLSTFTEHTGGKLPKNFAVTLPKITVPEQVEALTASLDNYPDVSIELMVETPQSLSTLSNLVELCDGRCVAAHLGPYDFTASLGIASKHQNLRHSACDFARNTMHVSLAGRGIRLADGPTTQIPIAPNKVIAGRALTESEEAENRDVIYRAWRQHFENISNALRDGFYQGWDLHPAQLPVRYAATYAFFLDGMDSASARMKNFVDRAAQATRIGEIFDDAASGQGLLNYFLRALMCGAIPESAVADLTGLSVAQLRTGSFTTIVKAML